MSEIMQQVTTLKCFGFSLPYEAKNMEAKISNFLKLVGIINNLQTKNIPELEN
jgi:uncharacterized membrane protein